MHSMQIGGAERLLIDILDNLNYNAFTVQLLLYRNEGGLVTQIHPNVKVISIYDATANNYIQRLIWKLKRITWLKELFERKCACAKTGDHYDAIISYCQGPAHKIHTYIKHKTSNNISWIHSDLIRKNWAIKAFDNKLSKQRDAYKMMDKLVFVSKGAQDTFNSLFEITNPCNQYVICNPIDHQRIAKLSEQNIPKRNNNFLFLNVGRLIEAKNQEMLIKASAILKERGCNFELWIVGSGPLEEYLQHCISELSLQDNVKLLGNQPNPYPYFKKSDAFILSSHGEGFPLVLGEAMSLSKPIISTRIPGCIEALHDGEYGMLVEETPEALATAMELFAKKDNIYKEYIIKAKKGLSSLVSYDEYMNKLYSLL